MEIIIDAMGGDNAPSEIVRGAVEASKESTSKMVLVGNRLRIEGIDGRREFTVNHSNLPQQIALFRRELQTFSVEFDQLTVKVADNGTAQAFCNASCSNMPDWVSESSAWALTATLEKDSSGDWRFTVLHFVPFK